MQRFPSMRPAVWAAVFCFLCAPVLGGEQSSSTSSTQQPPTTTFSATADLVLVPVVVRKGKEYVSGLTKDDFVVLEDNVPQNIAFVNAARSSGTYQKAGDGRVFTNELQATADPPRLTVIAVDNMNTQFVDQAWVIQQVEQFLGNAPTQRQPTAILGFTPSGIRVIHDFSTDTASLLAAFELASGKKAGKSSATTAGSNALPGSASKKPVQVLGVFSMSEPSMTIYTPICDERLTQTLDGLLVVAQSLSGIPGRKTMLWIASGAPFAGFERPDSFLLPVTSQSKPGNNTKQRGSNQELAKPPIDVFQGDPDAPCDLRNDELKVLRPKFERVLKQLADSSVAIYPVDARGIVVGFPGADELVDPDAQKNGTGDLGGSLASADFFARMSLQRFAEATGVFGRKA